MYENEYYYAASPSYWTYPGYTTSDYPNSSGQYGSGYDYRAATISNWMYMGWYDSTISRCSGLDYRYSAFVVANTGFMSDGYYMLDDYGYLYNVGGVRPTFYLNSSVTYVSGNGTSSSPYRIQ